MHVCGKLTPRWSLSFVHRPPGAKVEYEKEIRRVATFGSVCAARVDMHRADR